MRKNTGIISIRDVKRTDTVVTSQGLFFREDSWIPHKGGPSQKKGGCMRNAFPPFKAAPEIVCERRRQNERGPYYQRCSCLNVIVQSKFPGMRSQIQGLYFVDHFVGNPCFNDISGKDISLEKEIIILFQGIQGFT